MLTPFENVAPARQGGRHFPITNSNPLDSVNPGIRLHDDGEPHFHEMTDQEKDDLADFIWKEDNIELTTVGIDIGSSTSHLMFAKVHLQRKSKKMTSGFEVVNRTILWKSPILLTPFLPDNSIDAAQLNHFIQNAYQAAGHSR
jgi:ethanolamine utilization protein EutA